MIERCGHDKSVEAFICPRNSLSYRSDEEKRMHIRGAKRINAGDKRQIVPVKVNGDPDRPTPDIEDRATQIGQAEGPKNHRARVVVHT
jgi:hypothetical protein